MYKVHLNLYIKYLLKNMNSLFAENIVKILVTKYVETYVVNTKYSSKTF